jgi:hypothetical protein
MAKRKTLFERLTGHKPGTLGRREVPLPNPMPSAWRTERPDTEYPCAPGEKRWLGRSIPKHRRQGSGVVTGCATPTAREWERAAKAKARGRGNKSVQGQIIVTPASGAGYHITRNVAKLRVRDVAAGRVKRDDPQNIEARIQESRARKGRQLPQAPGVEFPHREGSTPCDPAHRLWSELEEAANDEGALAIIDAETPLTKRQLRAEVLRRVKQTAVYKLASEAEHRCAQEYEVRKDRRDASRGASRDRDVRQWRREYLAQGGDQGDPQYQETLSVSARAKALRKRGLVEQARQLERDERARKRGAGGRFRAG